MSASSSLTIKAELSQLRREIQESGALTEGETKRMLVALERRIQANTNAAKAAAKATRDAMRQTAKDAERAAAEVERAWDRGLDGLKNSAEKVASMVGGPVGDVADIVLDLGEKLASTEGALGAVGAGAGIALAAIGAVVVGTKELADAASEAEERLIAEGKAAEIPPEARAGVQHYRDEAAALRDELDLLTVTLGGGVAGGLADVAREMRGAILVGRDFTAFLGEAVEILGGAEAGPGAGTVAEALTVWKDKTVENINAQLDLLSLGVRPAIRWFMAYGAAAADAADAQEEASKGASSAAVDYMLQQAEIDDAIKANQDKLADEILKKRQETLEREAEEDERAGKAEIARQKRVAQELEAIEKDQRRMSEAAAASKTELRDEQAKADHKAAEAARELAEAEHQAAEELRTDLQDLQAALDELNGSWAANATAVEAVGEVVEERFGRIADVVLDTAGKITDALQAANERQIEGLQEQMQARRDAIAEWLEGEEAKVDAMVESGELSGKQAILEKRRLQEQAAQKRQNLQRNTKDEREAAMKAWERNQKLQEQMVVIEGARAAVGVWAGFAALGPVALGAAEFGVAATVAASLAEIESAEAPEFPMGRIPGTPDHTVTTPGGRRTREDEGIFDGRTTAALGGPEGVRDLVSRVRQGGGALPPTTIHLHVAGRLVGQGVLDELGDAVLQAVPGSWVAGRRPLYG